MITGIIVVLIFAAVALLMIARKIPTVLALPLMATGRSSSDTSNY